MKKHNNRRLSLSSESIRTLSAASLGPVQGAAIRQSVLLGNCPTNECPSDTTDSNRFVTCASLDTCATG